MTTESNEHPGVVNTIETPYGLCVLEIAPEKPCLIEGIPAKEWFQQEATRQGIPNKYDNL